MIKLVVVSQISHLYVLFNDDLKNQTSLDLDKLS